MKTAPKQMAHRDNYTVYTIQKISCTDGILDLQAPALVPEWARGYDVSWTPKSVEELRAGATGSEFKALIRWHGRRRYPLEEDLHNKDFPLLCTLVEAFYERLRAEHPEEFDSDEGHIPTAVYNTLQKMGVAPKLLADELARDRAAAAREATAEIQNP